MWAAFTLVQALAYVRWQAQPYWFVVVAGVRLTELYSDWTDLAVAEQVTWSGGIGLLIAPPANLVMEWFLIKRFMQITDRW